MNKDNMNIEDEFIVEEIDLNEDQEMNNGDVGKDKGLKALVLILILFLIAVVTACGANIFDRNSKQRELAEMQQETEDEISLLSEQCEEDAESLTTQLTEMNEYLIENVKVFL